MHPILQKLAGGDRRSTGRADEVAREIAVDPDLFEAVFDGMEASDPVVRMRAADAIEKATAGRPELLGPFKERLLGGVASLDQQEVQWHVAQMLPRLRLDAAERARAAAILRGYLDQESRIVRTSAMQALAELAEEDEALRTDVLPLLRRLTETGSPAMRARGRKLLARLEKEAR